MGLRTGQGAPFVAQVIGEMRRASAAEIVELGPLSPEDLRRLVGDVPGVVVEQLYHESGGNPFYALQLARSGLEPTGDAIQKGLGIPPAVVTAIGAELDASRTVRVHSPRRRLWSATRSSSTLRPPLPRAARRRCGTASTSWSPATWSRHTDVPRRFQFRHPLVRSSVYGSAPPSVRVSCHGRAWEVLSKRGSPAPVLALHVEQAAAHGDSAAIEILRRAGEETAARAPTSAAPWFAAALRLLPDDAPSDERIALLASLARARTAIGQFEAAHEALEEGIASAAGGDVELHVALTVPCAEIEQLMGCHNEARARLRRAYDGLVDPRSAAGVSLLIALSTNSLYLADHEGMLEWGRLSVEAADAVADDSLSAAALAAYAMGAAFAGRVELALELHGRATPLIDALGRRRAHGPARRAQQPRDRGALPRSLRAGLRARRARSLARAGDRADATRADSDPDPRLSLWMVGQMARSAEVLDEAIEAARLVENAQALSLSLFNRALSAPRWPATSTSPSSWARRASSWPGASTTV